MAYPQQSFLHTQFIPDSFFARKRNVVFENTLLYQLDVLKKTGRFDAFRLKWHDSYNDDPDHWPVPNHLFWDSDVAKWIEGACYLLEERKNETIEAAIHELVEMIRSAQQPDGYLNIHFTVVAPEQRFTNLRDLHELYNAGHLIEAALAHHRLYKNDHLLEPLLKYVDLFCQTFGPNPEQKHGYPGHPEIELALLRLYEVTKDPKHLALARYFIDERGNPTGANGRHYYDVEAEERGERPYERPNHYPMRKAHWYNQAHKPIVEQETIEGHSVRAMYLLTAVADLVRSDKQCNREAYTEALHRLWGNMVGKKMYLTGGIGAMKQYEGFGGDYFLPQGTDEGGCYSETCAAIGVMMLAERLLQLELDGRYGDVMELCLLNSVLTGMSCNGKQFTYVNQLASSDSDLSKRAEWFTCACCPPNVTRTLGYLGGYFWSFEANEAASSANINVHLFGSASLAFPVGDKEVRLTQSSNFPWDGAIEFELQGAEEISTSISIRIPGWVPFAQWKISPELPDAKEHKGYLHLPPAWLQAHPKFTLSLPMIPRLMSPHPYTNQDVVAVRKGPLIYCIEDVDNPWVKDHFKSLLFDTSSTISESRSTDAETGETFTMLTAQGSHAFIDEDAAAAWANPGIYAAESVDVTRKADVDKLLFVPYYFRANRDGRGHMRVGLRRKR